MPHVQASSTHANVNMPLKRGPSHSGPRIHRKQLCGLSSPDVPGLDLGPSAPLALAPLGRHRGSGALRAALPGSWVC